MGANAGIASLIGTIVLVVIGLMMLGLVEDGVTDALTESKQVAGAAISVPSQHASNDDFTVTNQTATFVGGVKSWYANKRVDNDASNATALGIFKIAPFLFLLGGILLTMVATAFTSVVNSGTSIRDVIIRAVIIFVGFMLITTITQALTDAREVFSYAMEYTGMSGGFSLVILLYAITLIIGLIGTAKAGYQNFKQGKEGM